MNRSFRIQSMLILPLLGAMITLACARQGAGNLVGGEKDEDPPVVMESTPENFTTNFTGKEYEFTFNEYFTLKDINNKLLISPPMEEKPEIKVKGKKLYIRFISELLPDRTYTLNFGDALVDLNESNPLDNFMVVFSTGDQLDSLEIKGKVVDAYTREPVEDVSVMLYPQPATDSLPLTTLPLYFSRTDKEGNYHLKNLAGGKYKIFALLDGNNNYLFDQPTEKVAFLDSLIQGDYYGSTDEKDTTDTTQPETDTTQHATRNPQPETDTTQPETRNPQLTLRLFAESPPRQYITGTERKRPDKILTIFNEPLDSISMELLYHDNWEDGLVYELAEKRDSITFWVTDSLLSMQDSLVFALGFPAYDSLEQRTWETDTIKYTFRHAAANPEEQTPMSIKANAGRTKELGSPLTITMGLPVAELDTSKISFYRIQDSLEIADDFRITEKEPPAYIPGVPENRIVTRELIIDAVLIQDSSYSLRILPGAFTGAHGFTNDSTNIDFTVNNIEKYGTLIMKVDSLNENAILQLTGAKGEILAERIINSPSTERFELLKPGKYGFKMVLDRNNNGQWDTGRYLRKIQPEKILVYDKEITLKANWEMEENWIIEPL